ncbi:unnamed protein product, partial [marine sediment metagenome]
MRKYKVAVTGCGRAGVNLHIKTYIDMEEIEVIAVCDNNQKRVNQVGKKFGIGKKYTDFNLMLSEEKPDISVICTPPSLHKAVFDASIQAGCHILLEKPSASSLEELEEMIDLSKEYNKKIMVNQNYRWTQDTVCAKKIVEKGLIGEVYRVEIIDYTWEEKDPTNSQWLSGLHQRWLFEQGVHWFDY